MRTTQKLIWIEWLLQHCSGVRPEKVTSKVRIMFNGSAPLKSLNKEPLTGLKPQSEASILAKNGWLFSETSVNCTTRLGGKQGTQNLQGSPVYVWWLLLSILHAIYLAEACTNPPRFVPLAAITVKKHCYMDDLIMPVNSEEKAIETSLPVHH